MLKVTDIASLIDHTLLKPDATEARIVQLCSEAREIGFHAVCVNPCWVRLATSQLRGTHVKVVSVAGFPLGANDPEIKIREAVLAVEQGASEIDVVANIGHLVSSELGMAEQELEEIRRQLPSSVLLKVIIETPLLSTEQQMEAVRVVINSGAQFVKSCTGFHGDVTVEQIQVLHMAAHGEISIKASGGIRSASQCEQLVEAGAVRIGTSAGIEIVRQLSS